MKLETEFFKSISTHSLGIYLDFVKQIGKIEIKSAPINTLSKTCLDIRKMY